MCSLYFTISRKPRHSQLLETHTQFPYYCIEWEVVTLFPALLAAPSDEDRQFSSLSDVVSEKTLAGIRDMGFTHMMEIQYRCIRPLLQGK